MSFDHTSNHAPTCSCWLCCPFTMMVCRSWIRCVGGKSDDLATFLFKCLNVRKRPVCQNYLSGVSARGEALWFGKVVNLLLSVFPLYRVNLTQKAHSDHKYKSMSLANWLFNIISVIGNKNVFFKRDLAKEGSRVESLFGTPGAFRFPAVLIALYFLISVSKTTS